MWAKLVSANDISFDQCARKMRICYSASLSTTLLCTRCRGCFQLINIMSELLHWNNGFGYRPIRGSHVMHEVRVNLLVWGRLHLILIGPLRFCCRYRDQRWYIPWNCPIGNGHDIYWSSSFFIFYFLKFIYIIYITPFKKKNAQLKFRF